MSNEKSLKPSGEQKRLQAHYGIDVLPLQDLCYATYTTSMGETLIVDILGTDLDETQAILSYAEPDKERMIWHAYRDQGGKPGTWLWTARQMEEARNNPVRIREEENYFAKDQYDTPGEKRQREIVEIGLLLGKSKEAIQSQLWSEGLEASWIEGDRIIEGQPGEDAIERHTDQLSPLLPTPRFFARQTEQRKRQ